MRISALTPSGIAQAATIPDPEIEAVVKMVVAAAIMGNQPRESEISVRVDKGYFRTFADIPWWGGGPTSQTFVLKAE